MDRGICVFKGIAYGADTAPRRFMAPVPPKSWAGVREAIEFGARAPQPPFHFGARAHHGYYLPSDTGPISEDCLYLNVWTPGLRDRSTMCFSLPPRPVDDPRGNQRRLIEQVPYLQRGT